MRFAMARCEHFMEESARRDAVEPPASVFAIVKAFAAQVTC